MSTYSDPETIRRLFSHPIFFPKEFKSWMLDQMALRIPDLPVGQVLGGRSLQRQIKHDASTVTVAGTDVETTVFSCDIPAGVLAGNGRLEIDFYWTAQCWDTSNGVVVRVKLGGSEMAAFGLYTAFLDATVQPGMARIVIQNIASDAQKAYITGGLLETSSFYSVFDGGVGGGGVNTAEKQTLEITADWSSAGTGGFVKKLVSVNVFNPTRVS